ncbi:MAG: hypothetical protein AB8B74_02810 [Crocinitomicaceae bacterium]
MKNQHFINFLDKNLSKSSDSDRLVWAKKIIDDKIDLVELINYFLDQKTSNRFFWLLSNIGQLYPVKLHGVLAYIFENRDQINLENKEATLANYFLLAGVPIEKESEVIDLLFEWIESKKMNVTTKSRSIQVLKNQVLKYPDLENEFQTCLEDQLGKYSADFDKKIRKALLSLDLN